MPACMPVCQAYLEAKRTRMHHMLSTTAAPHALIAQQDSWGPGAASSNGHSSSAIRGDALNNIVLHRLSPGLKSVEEQAAVLAAAAVATSAGLVTVTPVPTPALLRSLSNNEQARALRLGLKTLWRCLQHPCTSCTCTGWLGGWSPCVGWRLISTALSLPRSGTSCCRQDLG